MKSSLFICDATLLSDSSSKGFSIESEGEIIDGFVVKKDGGFYAYRNSCPHTGAPLDWVENQFLDMDGAFIQCSVHDARFNIENGYCIAGPCAGDSLQNLDVLKIGEALYLKAEY